MLATGFSSKSLQITQKNALCLHLHALKNIFVTVLRSMLGTEPAPTKVLGTKADNYSDRHIHCREEGLILYAPQNNVNNKKEKSKYEIVLHKPCTESLLYAYRFVRWNFRGYFICYCVFSLQFVPYGK